MPTHVALLRGVNVGGRNRVAMADLRRLVAELGCRDVATYVQSGNVVFTAGDAGRLAQALERAIAEQLNVRTRVVVLSRAELARVVAENPFPDETNPKALHAVLSNEGPTEEMLERVASAQERARAKGGRDEARAAGRTVYLRTPDGLGNSELAAQLTRIETGTARNWTTVTNLLALLQ